MTAAQVSSGLAGTQAHPAHPDQRTTAGTDVVLCVLAIAAAFYLHRISRRERWKGALWTVTFGLTATTAGLGALLHGFPLPPALHEWVWMGLSSSAGLAVAMLGVAMIYERWGVEVARRAVPVFAAATLWCFAARVGASGSDLPFRLFVAAVALFALGGYGWMALRRRAGAALMTAGIFVSLIGIAVHLRSQSSFTLLWTFDNNGIYHVVQMVGMAVMIIGLRTSLRPSSAV